MLPCHEVMPRLWEYIDGELTPERTDQIRAHLEMCERCFPRYDFQRAFVAFLQRQRREPAPPELRRRVFQRLLAESADARSEQAK